MNVWPVIHRELCAEARNPHHHWLRLTSASAVLAYFFLIARDYHGPSSYLGQRLFVGLLHSSVLFTLLLTPQLTADCLSREKREGTLGLLFLTPLTAGEIVLGKGLVHLLRAFTVLAALSPFFALPLLLGGVHGAQVLVAVVANVAAALVGLAAGLMASARNSEWMRAAVWAEFYVLALTLMVAPVIYLFFAGGEWVRSLGLIGTASLTLWTAVLRVSRRLKHRWQQEMVEPPRPRWTRNFHESDFWQGVFRWNKGRTLDRNPVAWLQEYSWTARLTKWGWLFLAIFGEVFGPQMVMWALIGAIAFAATGSFRRELQSGALELLLVTPLREWQLINGRLWGLFCHFLPAVLVWTVFRHTQSVLAPRSENFLADVATLYSSYLALPVVGFALAFWRLNLIGAFLLCLIVGVGLPNWIGQFLAGHIHLTIGRGHWTWIGLFVLLQGSLAGVAWMHLRTRLTKRHFLPQPAA